MPTAPQEDASTPEPLSIVVIGGGAAGYFAAIAAAEANPEARVTLLEKSKKPLKKVAISGGGRCNVTHACFEPRELARFYPRGSKELLGAFHNWQPLDTIDWFKRRGVELKTEADGRMFPTTDDSKTIIDCLQNAAQSAGVDCRLSTAVSRIERQSDRFQLTLNSNETTPAHKVVIATGGGQSNAGHQLARGLGHTITPLAPSLFTFNIDAPLLADLQGLSIEDVRVRCPATKQEQRGPVLVTHWGLSGPGILKLSAWGARKLHALDYQFEIRLNWLGNPSQDEARRALEDYRQRFAKRSLSSGNPFDLPKRFWERILDIVSASKDTQWAQLPKNKFNQIASEVTNTQLQVSGKSMNKEEFVTCGGISLREVDFKTMQSKKTEGLYFAGEALDIDGVTGGFNFQAAWTTGRLAGLAAAKAL